MKQLHAAPKTLPPQKVQQPVQKEKQKQVSYGYIPDRQEQQKVARPYLMIRPKLVEEIDENNMKKMKLSFHNSISDLQTFEDKAAEEHKLESTPTLCMTIQPKVSKHVRSSMRHLTQL